MENKKKKVKVPEIFQGPNPNDNLEPPKKNQNPPEIEKISSQSSSKGKGKEEKKLHPISAQSYSKLNRNQIVLIISCALLTYFQVREFMYGEPNSVSKTYPKMSWGIFGGVVLSYLWKFKLFQYKKEEIKKDWKTKHDNRKRKELKNKASFSYAAVWICLLSQGIVSVKALSFKALSQVDYLIFIGGILLSAILIFFQKRKFVLTEILKVLKGAAFCCYSCYSCCYSCYSYCSCCSCCCSCCCKRTFLCEGSIKKLVSAVKQVLDQEKQLFQAKRWFQKQPDKWKNLQSILRKYKMKMSDKIKQELTLHQEYNLNYDNIEVQSSMENCVQQLRRNDELFNNKIRGKFEMDWKFEVILKEKLCVNKETNQISYEDFASLLATYDIQKTYYLRTFFERFSEQSDKYVHFDNFLYILKTKQEDNCCQIIEKLCMCNCDPAIESEQQEESESELPMEPLNQREPEEQREQESLRKGPNQNPGEHFESLEKGSSQNKISKLTPFQQNEILQAATL